MWNTFGGKNAQKLKFALNPPFRKTDVGGNFTKQNVENKKV
ncbi:hypothetical protein NZD85_08295 [Empedobacter stercoris]|nr:hypothetical protein [Empedobacter stercoris]UWX65905.1 hypothetical protein NZD85_08295 [Empedobacter stercoris]